MEVRREDEGGGLRGIYRLVVSDTNGKGVSGD